MVLRCGAICSQNHKTIRISGLTNRNTKLLKSKPKYAVRFYIYGWFTALTQAIYYIYHQANVSPPLKKSFFLRFLSSRDILYHEAILLYSHLLQWVQFAFTA